MCIKLIITQSTCFRHKNNNNTIRIVISSHTKMYHKHDYTYSTQQHTTAHSNVRVQIQHVNT